ncbi:mu-type opioid receptor-like [Actinia tenebrosa]|uniref:Mu-type opioid receptor-like n=1 Tax=Actinia tenebrosa TaxID=6105 RepID=A0A6P8HIJ4_ACTTE|nr:mu-type opioid receptor-like [Actinia tenebrosa]
MANSSIPENDTFRTTVTITKPTKIALYCILLLWSLLGNTLVIAVVLTYERMKTNFNYLIVNMAVSDLLVPLVVLPFNIYKLQHPEWAIGGDFGNVLCKLTYIFIDISPFVSSLSLVIIATERLLVVAYPMLKNALFSGKRISLSIVLTWIAAAIFLSPYLYFFSVTRENGKLKCSLNPSVYPPYAICTFFAIFGIPLIAIIVIYTIMAYNLVKASKNVAKIITNAQMLSRQRRNRKIFYMSISIIVAFVILWGPFFFFLLIAVVLPKSALKELDNQAIEVAYFVCPFLAYANAAVNPCLYFIFLRSYREGACILFHKKSDTSDEGVQLEMTRVRSTSLTSRKTNRSLRVGRRASSVETLTNQSSFNRREKKH